MLSWIWDLIFCNIVLVYNEMYAVLEETCFCCVVISEFALFASLNL